MGVGEGRSRCECRCWFRERAEKPEPGSGYDIAFDTHRFVKRLTDCRFTEQQAETLADEHVALLNANLATKADVEAVRADIAKIEAGMDALRQKTKTVSPRSRCAWRRSSLI